ncbi:MAG: LytR/AlgR family response regulator transcription factor [Spirochaetota bacterium]
MRPIRSIIAEDERPARDRLRRALEHFEEIEVVGEAVHGGEAVERVRELSPDLLFLDVQMPVLDGFSVLQQLPRRPEVIFTTAYDEYAIRAFDVHAVDYLLKPYDTARLEDAVRRAIERLRRGEMARGGGGLDALLADHRGTHPYLSRLTIRSGRTYRVLPLDRVEYFRAEDGLVFWIGEHERYLVGDSLTSLESRLDPSEFLRIHRNTIARLDKIARVISLGRGRLAVEFISGNRADVGRTHTDKVRRVLRLSG